MKILFAAAGTGGHINPAIAIAKYFEEQENAQILFVGTEKGLENKLVAKANFPLKQIKIRGIERKVSISNMKAVKELMFSYGKARKIIREFQPDLVIGTGGYICGPVLSCSVKLKIPTIIHESNAFPGMTTKFLAKKVNAVALGFPEAEKHLPKGANTVHTGTPIIINREFLNMSKDDVKKALGYDEKPLLLIYGGSQGAASINKAVVQMIKKHSKDIDFNIVFATGNTSYEKVIQELENFDLKNMMILSYIYNMDQMMAGADLAITRSGAMTCCELVQYGLPAVMVPFPYAAENHQEFNARALERAGTAIVILDKDLNAEVLYKRVAGIMKDKQKLCGMSNAAHGLKDDKVLEKIEKLVKKTLTKNNCVKNAYKE